MKEYFENDEENVQMSVLHHLYYMKREKCADTTGDIMKKQNDTEDQEQPYLIERFDSYCKKVLRFEVMQYYHVKKIAERHIVLIDDVPQSITSLFCCYDEYPSLQNWFYVFGQEIEVKNSLLADALTVLTEELNIPRERYHRSTVGYRPSTDAYRGAASAQIRHKSTQGYRFVV